MPHIAAAVKAPIWVPDNRYCNVPLIRYVVTDGGACVSMKIAEDVYMYASDLMAVAGSSINNVQSGEPGAECMSVRKWCIIIV